MSVLNTAVSGMQANTNWLTTIAQNVANANTPATRTSRPNSPRWSTSAQNSPAQFAGVTTTTLALNALQGQMRQTYDHHRPGRTGRRLFHRRRTPTTTSILTRNGSFVPDAQGNLVNSAGYYLLGSPDGQTGVALNSLSGLVKVNVSNAADTSIPSTTASLVANLPSTAHGRHRRTALHQYRRLAIHQGDVAGRLRQPRRLRTPSISISPRPAAATPGRSTPTTPRRRRPAAASPTAPARWRPGAQLRSQHRRASQRLAVDLHRPWRPDAERRSQPGHPARLRLRREFGQHQRQRPRERSPASTSPRTALCPSNTATARPPPPTTFRSPKSQAPTI